jgi:hypothetical protein
MVEILDTKYEKAGIPAIVRDNYSRLSASEREKIFSMLLKFELLFNGTLNGWNLPPVSSELEKGMKPFHGRPYPVLHKHTAVLMKDIEWLWDIGVLEWQSSSQWASPTFFIPKKG